VYKWYLWYLSTVQAIPVQLVSAQLLLYNSGWSCWGQNTQLSEEGAFKWGCYPKQPQGVNVTETSVLQGDIPHYLHVVAFRSHLQAWVCPLPIHNINLRWVSKGWCRHSLSPSGWITVRVDDGDHIMRGSWDESETQSVRGLPQTGGSVITSLPWRCTDWKCFLFLFLLTHLIPILRQSWWCNLLYENIWIKQALVPILKGRLQNWVAVK
jgi:hypothetical protein